MCVAARNREKFTINPYFGGSRLFKVICDNIPQKLVAIACYDKHMSVPVCNHFHARRANAGKITSFWGVPLSTHFVCGDPPHPAA